MFEIISTYIANLISIVAIIIALSANRRVKQLEQRQENEKHLKRRTNLILESEKQNALIGELLLILVKKAELLSKNSDLQKYNQQEIKRLKNQIELFQSLKLNSKKRKLLGDDSIGTNVDIYHNTYEKVKQLTINLEAELKKERYEYEELVTKNNIT